MMSDAYAAGSPPVFCPLPKHDVKPTADLIADTTAWVEQFGFAQGTRAQMLSVFGVEFAASFFSDTTDERLRQLCRYSALAFHLDDLTATPALRGSLADLTALVLHLVRIADVPASHVSGGDPVLDSWHDIMSNVATWATPTQMQRFYTSFQSWMIGFVEEAAVRERGLPLDLDSYLRMRAKAVGCENVISCGELLFDVEPTAAERDLPALKAASEAATLTAALDNDRYSRAKKDREAENEWDVFDVIQHAHPDWTFAQALAEGVALRDQCLALYLDIRERLLPGASEQLRGYFKILDAVVVGNVIFGTTARRYLTPGHPATDQPWTSVPTTPGPALNLPTNISWWWQHRE